MKTRTLFLWLAAATLAAAQTPVGTVRVNPNTGALVSPTASTFRSANGIGTSTFDGAFSSLSGTPAAVTAIGANTGTVNLSGLTLTLPAGFATLTGTQTLTNKALSGGSNTLSAIGNGSLTNSAITIGGTSTALGGTITTTTILDSLGSTRGSVLERGESGWVAVTPGTSGYVWTSGGSGADPSWQAASGGGGDGSSLDDGGVTFGFSGSAWGPQSGDYAVSSHNGATYLTDAGFVGDGSALTSLPSSALTGALPALDGSALTGLSAASLTGAWSISTLGAVFTFGGFGTTLGMDGNGNLYLSAWSGGNKYGFDASAGTQPVITGDLTVSGSAGATSFTGDGSGLTALPATQLTGALPGAVADGTYTMGIGGSQNGTITITNGIITAVQEAMP